MAIKGGGDKSTLINDFIYFCANLFLLGGTRNYRTRAFGGGGETVIATLGDQ